MIFKIFNQSSIYIFAPINFLTENQIRKYVQLCCLGSGTFLQFFHFMLIWSFEEKILFTLYLQSCKECNAYLINQLNAIWAYFRNRLVRSDICFSVQFSAFCYFCSTMNYRPVSIDIKVQLQSNNVTLTALFVVVSYCIYTPFFINNQKFQQSRQKSLIS